MYIYIYIHIYVEREILYIHIYKNKTEACLQKCAHGLTENVARAKSSYELNSRVYNTNSFAK